MSTATVPLAITCPDWCDISPAKHAEDLWNWEGHCIHSSSDFAIRDEAGWTTYGEPTRFHPAQTISLSSVASPDGRETESPMLHLAGNELSVQQALALADAIRELVQQYRSTGGVA